MRKVAEFSVPFAMGMPRPRVTMRGTYTPRAAVRAKERVRLALMDEVEGAPAPLVGPHVPVHVQIDVTRRLPESRPRRVTEEPDTYKPDGDNIAKLVLDSLNGVAWADDAQVVDLLVRKHPRRRGARDETRVRISVPDEYYGGAPWS